MLNKIIKELKSNTNEANLAGMARFGINISRAFGVSMPILRAIAKNYKKNQELSLQLWESGYHEAKILASLVGDPAKVTESQMEKWVKELDSWDVCDQVCLNLFQKTKFAWEKAHDWAGREEEYVRRAAFAMIAVLAVHDKKAEDQKFIAVLSLIEKYSADERNFVKKAVNWALRQIGKRNLLLNKEALKLAKKLSDSEKKSARWIGADAVRELESEKVLQRIESKNSK